MSRPYSRHIITASLLATVAVPAAARAQSARATIMISATVVEASTTPDAALLAPRLSVDGIARAGAHEPARITGAGSVPGAPVAGGAMRVSGSPDARYRVTIELADSASVAPVLVRDAAGAERRIAGGRQVVVADSLTAAEALRAPVALRVGRGAADTTVRLRYVVTPMEALSR